MKVFLSSTTRDLEAYRRVADDTLLRLEKRVEAMERFGPRSGAPVTECERAAADSDIIVCIVAHRYGFVPEKGKGSITRREVEAAYGAGKDVLVWIVADDHPWTEQQEQDLLADPTVIADPARVTEVVEGIAALHAFKKWLRDTFVCDTFTTPDDLGKKIAIALQKYSKQSQPTAAPPPQDRISIARLPTSGSDLFGRDAELQLLDNAWANSNTNIVSFVAWGGVGKTALVNHWLKRGMARDNYRGAERVYGWSFFSQGTSERAASADLFIDQALRWHGDSDPTAGSPWDKGERLARYIRQTRTLLVLDGLEPLQHPPGLQEGRLKDAALQALLVELAAHQPGLCVISTRERVGDLAEFEGGTVVQLNLDNLSPQAGSQILRSLNVKGDGDELEQASRELGGHAFSLTLLGSYLDEVLDGDIRRRRKIENLFEDTRHGDAAQRMIAAYESWLGEGMELAILRLLGLFDRPADLPSLIALREPPVISRLTEPLQQFKAREWSQAVAKLRRIKLLVEQSPNEPGQLDAHPLVREHFKQQLKRARPEAWRDGNDRLYCHLKNTAKQFPESVEEMSPLFAAVAHGCAAGKHQTTLDEVYWQRIHRKDRAFSIHKLGAVGADLVALTGFYVRPWQLAPGNLTDSAKGFILNETGYDLRLLGRLQEAIRCTEEGMQVAIGLENWRNAGAAGSNLSELYMLVGDVVKALEFAKEGVALGSSSASSFQLVANKSTLADAFHQAGLIDDAMATFRDTESLLQQTEPEHPLLYSTAGFRYCDLLLRLGEVDEVKKRATETRRWAIETGAGLITLALDYLTLGRAWLLSAQQGSEEAIPAAAKFLGSAVDGLREANAMEFIARSLLARAELSRFIVAFENAERDLAEVLRIVTRKEVNELEEQLG